MRVPHHFGDGDKDVAAGENVVGRAGQRQNMDDDGRAFLPRGHRNGTHGAVRPAGEGNRLLEQCVRRGMSELDRAAAPLQQPEAAEARAQTVAFVNTDGRAMRDNGETAMPVNRFTAFADSVKTIPQAPWFDSVLFVIGGAIAAFAAARGFMRA